MLDTLDAPAVVRWSELAAASMHEHRAEIDALNVFPVPDGDTGTNLARTLDAAASVLRANPVSGAGAALRTLARGALLGARGNSGVIVSQLLRGLAETVDEAATCDAPRLQQGLRRAAELAYLAVAEPVEGTILTVARAAAEAAGRARQTLGDVVDAAVDAATTALRRTPDQLPVLARAGVVDAGGRGLVVLLDALAHVVTGALPGTARIPDPATAVGPSAMFEVQYLVAAGADEVARLRSRLGEIGGSLAVVDAGDGVWNVHVHTRDAGAAFEAGIEAGRPHRVSVMLLPDVPVPSGASVAATTAAIVAVAPGAGLAHLFEAEGVRVVDDNPSTGEVLAAIRATRSAHVVLLPNDAQVKAVADLAADQARREGVEVAVVPTRSPVQGLAAVAVHDGARRFGDDVVAMAEAAAATRWAEVTVAAREALTSAGRCAPGDVLGLIDGDVVEIGSDVSGVARALVGRLLRSGGELVTVVLGRDADAGLGAVLRGEVAQLVQGVEVTVFDGGQSDYPVLLGVE